MKQAKRLARPSPTAPASPSWANASSLPFEAGLSNKGAGGNAGLVILTYIATSCSL